MIRRIPVRSSEEDAENLGSSPDTSLNRETEKPPLSPMVGSREYTTGEIAHPQIPVQQLPTPSEHPQIPVQQLPTPSEHPQIPVQQLPATHDLPEPTIQAPPRVFDAPQPSQYASTLYDRLNFRKGVETINTFWYS